MISHLARIALWSLGAFAIWKLLDPLWTVILQAGVELLLALAGSALAVDVGRSNYSPVIFVALFLAQRPEPRSALAAVPLGILACLAVQAAAIATLATHPSHQTPGDRLVRSFAVGMDMASPILLWILTAKLKPRRRPAA